MGLLLATVVDPIRVTPTNCGPDPGGGDGAPAEVDLCLLLQPLLNPQESSAVDTCVPDPGHF